MHIPNKISTKIKIIGALLIFLMLSTIIITIYLNQQNIKDALVINIAGKQRMLTQKISKNIFYIHYSEDKDFYELNQATNAFIQGLNTLKHGNEEKETYSAPNKTIKQQLVEVDILWKEFYENIQNFKIITNSNSSDKDVKLKEIILFIYKNNTTLLNNVDKLVTMYTLHSENKTEYMKTFQYISATLLLLVFIYSLFRLREIESHAEEFIKYSKELINDKNGNKLIPIEINAESEIIEVSDTINCFIDKINTAMDYSSEALQQSQNASIKLEELTDEFDNIIGRLQDNSIVSRHLNNSEDIVIESTEELLNSTKKLQILKEELQKLTKSCQELQV